MIGITFLKLVLRIKHIVRHLQNSIVKIRILSTSVHFILLTINKNYINLARKYR